MHIDYPQKLRLMEHFSRPAHWRNTFDLNFFTDPGRKGSTRQVTPAASRFTSTDGRKTQVTHSSGASVSFDLQNNMVVAIDESGISFTVSGKTLVSDAALPVTPVSLTHNPIDIPGTNITLHFDDLGNKAIILGDHQFTLPAPKEKPSIPLTKGAQIHVASISDAQASGWDIPPADMADVIKMVIARDLGLENDLEARNIPEQVVYTLETHVPGTDIRHLRPFERARFLEKPWRDTVEFEGHDVAQPLTFFVEKDHDGFNLITSLDQREAIWSQGSVLRAALSGATPPVRTLTAKAQAHHVLQLLAHGATTRDERAREWNYVIIETPGALDVAAKIRSAMRQEFGLTARHCSVMTFEKGLCVLAMASRVIDAAARHSEVARDETHLSRMRDAARAAGLTPL